MPTNSVTNLYLHGTITRNEDNWIIAIPVLGYSEAAKNIFWSISRLEAYFKQYSQDSKAKYSIKIQDGGKILVSSSNFTDFVAICTQLIIRQPDKEKALMELLSYIVVEIDL